MDGNEMKRNRMKNEKNNASSAVCKWVVVKLT